jgi:hypothetical protein
VKSKGTRRFWDLFHKLPEDIQALAIKNYRLWRNDPNHPSLRFRKLQGSKGSFTDRYTVRVGDHHRALGMMTGSAITWVWIGTHAEYDRLVGR